MALYSTAPLDHMFFAASAVVLISVVVSWQWRRDLLFPPIIVALQWAAILALFLVFRDRFIPVASEVWALITIGAAAFVIGGLVVTRGFCTPVPLSVGATSRSSSPHWGVTRLSICLAALGLPFFAKAAYDLAVGGPTSSLAVNLRLAYVDANVAGPGLYVYLVPISFVATAALMAVDRAKFGRTFWLWLGSAVSLSYALLATGRGTVLFFIFMLLGMVLIRRVLSPGRAVASFFVLVVVLWVLAAVALGKGLSADTDRIPDIASGLFDDFLVYLLGGLPALGIRIEEQAAWEFGANTFRTVLAVASAAGVDVSPPNLVREFVSVPSETNVFTVYEPYYRDFSVYGVALSQFLFGAVHTFAYERGVRGSVPWQIIFSALLFPACTQFFQDHYASLLSLWIQVALAAVVLTSIHARVSQRITHGS